MSKRALPTLFLGAGLVLGCQVDHEAPVRSGAPGFEVPEGGREPRQVGAEGGLHLRPVVVEVHAAEVRVLVRPGRRMDRGLHRIGPHGPPERMDRADGDDRRAAALRAAPGEDGVRCPRSIP